MVNFPLPVTSTSFIRSWKSLREEDTLFIGNSEKYKNSINYLNCFLF